MQAINGEFASAHENASLINAEFNFPMEAPRAVKISSKVLGQDFWLVLDRTFDAKDGLARYFPEEIPFLDGKSPEELRKIHEIKVEFPDSVVRGSQRAEEPKKQEFDASVFDVEV